jgi:serine/threonine-protein kinase
VPEAPSTINPRIPAELDHIVAKTLEKDRELRYQTAAELRADLKRLKRESDATRETVLSRPAARDVPSASRSSGTVPAVAVPSSEPSVAAAAAAPKRGLLIAAAAVVLLALAGYTAWRMANVAPTGIDSIAVLPFTATGPSSGDTEYLTDGITESLINGLAQLGDLHVSARSVVFKYKNKSEDPQQIGRDLNVRAVVTGRVAVRNDQLVIHAELMNVETGTQIWGDQYSRPQSALLAVQEEIATEILDKIRPRLSGEVKEKATKRHTEDSAAYQLYLQGRFHWNKGTTAGYKNAIEYFQRAIARDQRYALAYAGLADSHLMLGSTYVESLREAKAAAEEARKLDPNLAEAHVALGQIKLWIDWQWPEAEREFKQGLSLNQSSALAHNQYAMYLATLGRVQDALAEVQRALDLDQDSVIVNTDFGWHLLFAGRHADAIAQFRKTLAFDANAVPAHRGLGVALSEDGRHDDAIAEFQRTLPLSEHSPVIVGHLGAAYARAKRRGDAEKILKELQALSEKQYVPASSVAMVHAALGDRAKALDWLEKAHGEHDFSIAQIGVAPWFKDLRNEPRFQALLKRIGLQ